jgi:hypothetical protein
MGNCIKNLKGGVKFQSKILNKEELELPIENLKSKEKFIDTYKISKLKFRKSGYIDVLKVISFRGREESVAKIYR